MMTDDGDDDNKNGDDNDDSDRLQAGHEPNFPLDPL